MAKIENRFQRRDIAAMTPEQLAHENSLRAPSEQIDPNRLCGANLPVRRADGTTIERPNSTCGQTAGANTSHPGWGRCKAHGGNTPAGKKFAVRAAGRYFLEQQKARYDMFGGDRTLIHISEEEALLEEVRRSVAMVRFLEERIGAFEIASLNDLADLPDASLGGLPSLVDETSKGAATITDVNAWLLLYREERQHAAKTAKMAIDAGLASRIVRIAEDQGRMLAQAVRAVLDALHLTPDQAALVPMVVPGILRSVSQGDSAPITASSPPHPTLLEASTRPVAD